MSEYYGFDVHLKEYLDIPSFLPIKYTVYLEHGISLLIDYVDGKLQTVSNELILVNNAHRKKFLSTKINCQIEVLGPLAIHFRRMNGVFQDKSAKGTLVFPSHSTHHVDSVFNWESYADDLLTLPDYLKPLKVCLYWKDVLLDRQKIFEDRGMEVVSNGHIYDKEHIRNTYENLKGVKYITGNSITSAFFYGMEMGIPAFVYGGEVKLAPSSEKYKTVINKSDNAYLDKAFKVFKNVNFKNELIIDDASKKLMEYYIDEPNWVTKRYAKKLVMKKLIPSLVGKGINLIR